MDDLTDDVGSTVGPEGKIPEVSSASAPPPTDPDVWPRIDGYQLKKLMGEGAQGRVYLALEVLPNREVALKVVKGNRATSEAAKSRFFREIGLAGKLEHRHIARVYHCGSEPRFFFSMEMVKGVALDKFVRTAGLDRRGKLQLFRQVCQAVSYAHHSLVVHLDLKPSNILVDDTGNPRVLDFGLAMALSKDGGWEYTEREGTPAYMSPEQARGDLALNNAVQSDTYSLGVILYTLLTGKFPHDITGPKSEVMQRVANTPIRPPRQADPRMPRELAAMLNRALTADPNKRYASVADFDQDLGNYLDGNPIKAVPNTTPYVLKKWFWKHRYGLTLTAGILAVLASVAVFSYVNIARARNVAELRRAEVLVSTGNLLEDAGKWNLAKEAYRQAHELFAREGGSSTAADLGTWSAFRNAPPPLSVMQGEGGVIWVALTSDGRRAVTGSKDGRLRMWDVQTGRQIGQPIELHSQMILHVAVASRADLALTGSADATAKLVDLNSMKVVATLQPAAGWVTRVALSDDGRRAMTVTSQNGDSLTSDQNDRLWTWDMPGGTIRGSGQANGQVVCAAFSPDGSIVATGGHELAFWDAATLRKLSNPAGGEGVLSLAYSPDGKQLATGGGDAELRLWDISTGRQIWAAQAGSSALNAVAFSRDGQAIFSTGNDGLSQVWSRSTGEELTRLTFSLENEGNSTSPVLANVVCADGDVEARVSADETLSFWVAAPPVEVRRFGAVDSAIRDVGFMSDGRLILAATSKGLKLWDQPTGQLLDLPPPRIDSADAMALAPDGSTLAVISGDELHLVDVATWKVAATAPMNRRPNSPAVLSFAPNGHVLVSSGPDFALSVRDARTLAEIGRLAGPTSPVTAAVFSPDSARILSGGRDRAVRLWNAVQMQPVRAMMDHLDAVNAVVFSPDGHFAFSAGGNSDVEQGQDDFAVRQWNLDTGGCVARFTGHQARIRALAISPDGSILVSASDDRTLKLWQTKDGKELFTLTGHSAPVVAVKFAADGGSILSADEDDGVLLWDLSAPRRQHDLKDQAGERFAFLGLNGWAADRLLADQADGMRISHLTLARCLWKLGETDRAVAEMNAAQAGGEAPADYLELWLRTLRGQHK